MCHSSSIERQAIHLSTEFTAVHQRQQMIAWPNSSSGLIWHSAPHAMYAIRKQVNIGRAVYKVVSISKKATYDLVTITVGTCFRPAVAYTLGLVALRKTGTEVHTAKDACPLYAHLHARAV
jgi:hypothetical protein